MKKYLWTKLKVQLEPIRITPGKNYNWFFLPAPGLGSESLSELTKCLHLPGTMWYFTLPGVGSNITKRKNIFLEWPNAIIEAVQILDNVVLVAHSTSAMYLLTIPHLERYLSGIVLMGAAPNKLYIEEFEKYTKKHPFPEVDRLSKIYTKTKSNYNLKKLITASAPYFLTREGLKKDLSFLKSLTCNYKVEEYISHYFDPCYEAKWVPQKIPALMFTGDKDFITPLCLLEKSKEYKRDNILLRKIKNASHYPWIENPAGVECAFAEYLSFLDKT